jgi:hypothetical protein
MMSTSIFKDLVAVQLIFNVMVTEGAIFRMNAKVLRDLTNIHRVCPKPKKSIRLNNRTFLKKNLSKIKMKLTLQRLKFRQNKPPTLTKLVSHKLVKMFMRF